MNEIACPRCQIGYLHAEKATYTYVHNGMLLSVPNMPAWKCDICQYQEFDYDALTRDRGAGRAFWAARRPGASGFETARRRFRRGGNQPAAPDQAIEQMQDGNLC